MPFNLVLSLALVWFEPIREAAFAIASSIVASINVVVGLVILQRRTKVKIVDRAAAVAVLKMLVAAAAAMTAVWFLRPLLSAQDATFEPGLLTDLLHRTIDACGSLAAGVFVYLSVAALLGLPEPRLLLSRFARRRLPNEP